MKKVYLIFIYLFTSCIRDVNKQRLFDCISNVFIHIIFRLFQFIFYDLLTSIYVLHFLLTIENIIMYYSFLIASVHIFLY